MSRERKMKRAQAAVEVAICGSLFLMVLGTLVSYGVRFNAQQELTMKSFRHALRKASSEGIGDEYLAYSATHIKDIPIPDVSSPYGGSHLQEIASGASATRSYFMMQAEQPYLEEVNSIPDENGNVQVASVLKSPLPRVHYVINDKERPDYDHGRHLHTDIYSNNVNISDNPTKDGFTTAALSSVSFIKEGEHSVVIRLISDPEDKLAPQGIYWTWIKMKIPKSFLYPGPDDSYKTRTDGTIGDIATGRATDNAQEEINKKSIWVAIKEYYPDYLDDWGGVAANRVYDFFGTNTVVDYAHTNKWREERETLKVLLESEISKSKAGEIISALDDFFDDLPDLVDEWMDEVTIFEESGIVNLGTDLKSPLNTFVFEDDLFKKVRELPIVAQGTELSPDCLNELSNDENRTRKVTAITIQYADSQWRNRVYVKVPYLGEINPEAMTHTVRGMAEQGLQPTKRSETKINNLKLTNTQEGNIFRTDTKIDSKDTITRYIKFKSLFEKEIEIEDTRTINENEKYKWSR